MTIPTVAPMIRNMPCSRLTRISARGDVAHLEVGVHGDADVAQRAGERRRIGAAHAHADARGIDIAKRGRVIDALLRQDLVRRKIGNDADDFVPALEFQRHVVLGGLAAAADILDAAAQRIGGAEHARRPACG